MRQPVGKVTVQITRGEQVLALPLDKVIQSPRENVPLAPGDVVTVMFQPLSFTALGATGQNAEIAFEAQGISLAQALARAGGVQDVRSDARGVFVFRFEDARGVTDEQLAGPTTPDGKVPVVYRVDLTDPHRSWSRSRSHAQPRCRLRGQRAVGRVAEVPQHPVCVDLLGAGLSNLGQ